MVDEKERLHSMGLRWEERAALGELHGVLAQIHAPTKPLNH